MITIDYHGNADLSFDPTNFEPVIIDYLKKHKITDNVRVELSFVGEQEMRRLNKQYRGRDYSTDVLSFPIWPNLQALSRQKGKRLLGSIIVCLPVVATAERKGIPIKTKINQLISHSLDHLVGIHHSGD